MQLTRYHAEFEEIFTLRAGADRAIRALIERQLGDTDCEIFVHDASDSIDGFCTVRADEAPPIYEEVLRAEVTDLLVCEPRRRCGIGRALLGAAVAWAENRGIRRVEVRVASGNAEGRRFWDAQGFEGFVDVLHRRL
jgi:GNAT superfamily N-acetyltransferase